VFITDGDDCSLVEDGVLAGLTTEDAVDARCAMLGEPPLASIGDSIGWVPRADPRMLIGVLIGGTPPRLSQVAAALPERNNHVDISQPNWGDALVQLAGWGPSVGNPCLVPEIDMEPTIPGIQPECVASFHTHDASTLLSWCNQPGASSPCMRLVADPLSCPDSPKLDIEGIDEHIVGGAWVDVHCAIPCE
jgi:hypothetical protein